MSVAAELPSFSVLFAWARTEAEFRAPLESSGLRVERVVAAASTAFSVIETLAV